MTGTGGLVVVTALGVERAALAGHVPGATFVRCGMGPTRVAAWAPRLRALDPAAVVVAGLAGGVDPAVRPGDVVVASEVRAGRGSVPLPAAAPLVAQLRRLGLRVHSGPVLSSDHVVGAAERASLVATGVLAVDMESAAVLTGLAAGRRLVPVAVLRVVVDTAASPLLRPATMLSGVRALRTLARIGPALSRWSALLAHHEAAGEMAQIAAEPVEHAVVGRDLRFASPGEVVS